jgi:glycosyltransferase involved in cell wall biosynthesis
MKRIEPYTKEEIAANAALVAMLDSQYSSEFCHRYVSVKPDDAVVREWPTASVVLESYNHADNVEPISRELLATPLLSKVVVFDDGSSDDSLVKWSRYLTQRHQLVVRSNNLHEIRAYNLGIDVAGGDVIGFLQDDDLLPMNDRWIRDAVRLFHALPELDVLSGIIGLMLSCDGMEFGEHSSYNPAPAWVLPFEADPGDGYEPIPFSPIGCAALSPLFVRRSFLESNGLRFNTSLSNPGEPGILLDCVLSYEALIRGRLVGVYPSPFVRGIGGHASMATPEKAASRVSHMLRNRAWLESKFDLRTMDRLATGLMARLWRGENKRVRKRLNSNSQPMSGPALRRLRECFPEAWDAPA